MNALVWLFLGLIAGVALTHGAAWTAATARIIETEERHQQDLNRVALVQRYREAAIERGLNPDMQELNAWQLIDEKKREEAPFRVLSMRRLAGAT